MSAIPASGDNPQGLATFEPMDDPAYRAVARKFLDGYLHRKGFPPCTWPEDVIAPERPNLTDGDTAGIP